MSLVPVYRDRPSALHAARAGVAAAFCCAFALAGSLYRHPLVLAGALGGVVAAGVAAGVGREMARSLRLALPFALLLAVVNAVVYQEGATLLLRGGQFLGRSWDITLESAAYGAFNAMRIVVLIAALGGLMSARLSTPTSCSSPCAVCPTARPSPPRWPLAWCRCWRATPDA